MEAIINYLNLNINTLPSQPSNNHILNQPEHGCTSMDINPSELQIEASAFLRALNKNQRAMIKRIKWFNTNGYHQCCFETVPQMGADLSKWGGKDVKRSQAQDAYRAIRRLLNSEQPHHKGRYRRTFNPLGLAVIQLMEQGKSKPDTQVFKTRHPNTAKPDTLNPQKPTLLKSIKEDKTKTKEKAVKFSTIVINTLESLDADLSYKATEEFQAYLGSNPVTNASKVMEAILVKHVATQAYRHKEIAKDNRRAAMMIEQAKEIKLSLDSVDIGDKDYRMNLSQRFMQNIRADLRKEL